MKWNLSEVKNTIYKIKNLLDYISSRLDIQREKKINELKSTGKKKPPKMKQEEEKKKKTKNRVGNYSIYSMSSNKL